ncbi:hypothetical protein B1199_05225 [Pseudoalteromonas ulvae]|uniref:Uncharacterized protein n=1 Tax=Pseudoalteromonas ulvae TaxID=107327 RepID=A0A244CW32_PSEDV|nr:hypothetical protein B1199_05225 [Pseudoalteromonas ulvae]
MSMCLEITFKIIHATNYLATCQVLMIETTRKKPLFRSRYVGKINRKIAIFIDAERPESFSLRRRFW